MRRVLTILAIIIVLLGIGAVVYYLYFKNNAGIEVTPTETANLPLAGDAQPITNAEVPETAPVVETPNTPPARLVKISAGPVVPGAVLVNVKATASSSADVLVSYIERQSGNVYRYSVQSGTRTRTSNRTVPGIQSASWLPNASLAFVRYLSGADFSTVNTYALKADGTDGFFMSQNLADLAVSSTSVLTLSSGVNGSIASSVRTDGTQAKEVFSTPLSSLRVSFAGKNQYLAFTKPAAKLSGSAFLVDATGHFSRMGGAANGLVAKASPSGKWLLLSSSNAGVMRMNLVDTTTGESIALPIATIADKCTWTADDAAVYCGIPDSPSSNFEYPDDWYQGGMFFSDRIWKIQVSGRYAQFVLDFTKETEVALDATALALDPSGTVLVFLNKRDGSLWAYSL